MHTPVDRFSLAFTLIGLLLGTTAHAQSQSPPPPTTVDASEGGVTFSSGPNSLSIGARMQFRWTFEDRGEVDADEAGSGFGRADGWSGRFDIPQMRVTLAGGVYRPWLRYSFQYEFGRTSGESSSKIKDAYIEIRPAGTPYRVRLGQFKAPFGLQQQTSSGRLQFAERAITDSKFNPGRDMGVMVSGTAADRKVGYEAGLFNGSGESVRQNTRSHLVAGRVYVQPFGTYSLSEGSSDMHAGDAPVLHVGFGARTGKQVRGRTASDVFEGADNQSAFNGEFAFKAPRFFTTAEYFWMSDEQDNPVAGPTIDSRGFHAQASYMLLPRRVEAGLLFARITPDSEIDDAEVTELRGVVNYYWRAHNLKLQADIGQLGYGENFGALSSRARQGLPSLGPRLVSGEKLTDTQLRVQMQVSF